jgi:hypothetical protein
MPSRRPRWTHAAVARLAVVLAVLALATAAIVLVPWPFAFLAAVVAAAVWCWDLDQPSPPDVAASGAPIGTPRRNGSRSGQSA